MNLAPESDKLCQSAWLLYQQGELSNAIATAREARQRARHGLQILNSCAALGWFLIEQGDLPAAESVLMPALASAPHQAILQWRVGVLQQKKGQLAQAIEHIEHALAIDPSLDEAAATLAWLLHEQNRLPEAVVWVQRAMALRATPERQAQLGWFLLLQGKPAQAAALLEESLKTAPQVVSTHVHLARARSEEHKTTQALHILEDALERFPESQALLLAIGWLHRDAHEYAKVQAIAAQVIALQADCAGAWLLMGLAQQGLDNPETAATHFRHALELDASMVDASIPLAIHLRNQHRFGDATAVIANALRHHHDHPTLCEWQVQLALDSDDAPFARRRVHQLLAKDRANGRLWYLLALTLQKRHRIKPACMAVKRALRYEPYSAQAWTLAAWLSIDDGRLDDARQALQQLIARCPELPDLDNRAVFILAACDDLEEAAMHAQAALARQPQSAQALQSLGHVRKLQGHLREAEHLTRRALAGHAMLEASLHQQLAWILRAGGRLDEAVRAFQQACELNHSDIACLCEYAETQALAGDLESATLTLGRARAMRPDDPQVQLLHAQLLHGLGPSQWGEAIAVCARLLRRRTLVTEAAFVLLAIAARGHPKAQQALRLVSRSERRNLLQACLDTTQARGTQSDFLALACLAVHDFPNDASLRTAWLCAQGTANTVSVPDIARQTRAWGRYLTMQAGTHPARELQPIPRHSGRTRIAYVAAHFHRSLLTRVLAAHSFDEVDVFLYCDISRESLGDLAHRVCLEALGTQDLAASMHANQIDVAIDTVGVGPFLGQDKVLLQFARRIAPIQCAWLGSWASSGGVFDYLLSDTLALPQASEGLYEEGMARVPGGQWCWDPPVAAPSVSPSPFLFTGRITLGCAVRAFRISPRAIHVWMRILLRLENAQLVLMGEHGQSAQFRTELFAAMTAMRVDHARVSFQAQRGYHDYLANYGVIDIALDSFPANGGLCLLDALWMGVPVVTLAGSLLGERQGLSILGSIGHTEWVASDEEAYVNTVCALAGNPDALANLRQSLRVELQKSPLIDGRRVAHAIETHCQQWRQEAHALARMASPKEQVRALAQRQLDAWLTKNCRLEFAPPLQRPTPQLDLSVVVVLFNQPGLSRQALSALADQTGVCFEAILVDNASGMDTGQLLGRVDGARMVRNTNNVGFLHAANQGAALASGRHILFLNSDAVLHTDALSKAVERLDSDQRVGAVGGRIVLADGTLQEAGCIAYAGGSTAGYGRGQAPHLPEFSFVRDVDFCSGAFLMVRRSLWLELGGFDPAFAPAYYEDSDFCLRVQDAGYRVVYEPGVWISHFEWGSAASNQEAIAMMDRNCQRFSARHQARLALRPEPTQASPHLDRWRVRRKTRILILDNGVPHMAAGGGLPRARLIVQALSCNDVTLFPLWDTDDDWREVYASVPETVEVMLGIGAAGLESLLAQRVGVYDYVMVSRPPNMALLDALRVKRPELFEGVQVVYDAEALFALREIGKASLQGAPLPQEKARQLLEKELALALRADAVISVSASEARRIHAAGAPHVHLLSHAMETRGDAPDWSPRENLLFVGAIHPHTPNEDSLLWFCQEVMPILRNTHALNVCLDIVGDCTSGPVAALADSHIRVWGRVDDLTPWYDRHRVFIAPTRFAAGVPAKVIEAACQGIPVVATPLLVDQLGWQVEQDILAADAPQAFAAAIATLYTDPEQWCKIRTAMQARTRTQYAPEQFRTTLRSIFTLTQQG